MTEHNNPPAFPNVSMKTKEGIEIWGDSGMTLLDHFAGLAMQGMLSASENYPTPELAGYAYQVADAMLKERAKWIK